jgi:hypothetical protein
MRVDRPDGQGLDEATPSHPEQIIRKLRMADRLLADGHDVPEVAKQLEVSEATYHRHPKNPAALLGGKPCPATPGGWLLGAPPPRTASRPA